MKRLFCTTFLFLFIFSSCEEVIDVKVPSTEPILVVDAFLEVFFNEQPIKADTTIKLRLSGNYFAEENPLVTDATVFITNLSDNSIINYADVNQDGDYEPLTNFIPQNDIAYELTIEYKGETYKAVSKRIKTSSLKNVIQGDETLFTGDETQLKVSFIDNIEKENYYRFSFDNGLYRTLEDRFINGSDYEFSFFYQDKEVELPSTVTIKISGITKDYFSYFNVLLNQSGQTGGGPFQTIPSTLLGNLVNKDDKKNFALGYFLIADTDTRTINLTKK